MESQWIIARRNKRNGKGSARQVALARLILSIRRQLVITQIQLAKYLGVSEASIRRWEKGDGTFPRTRRWYRIRTIWALVQYSKSDKFWRDREDPPDFGL